MPRFAGRSDDDVLAPGAIVGDYVVESVLGAGRSSVVYQAEQQSLERAVALKLLARPLAEDRAERDLFRERGATVAALEHPHVVPVYEFGEDDGRVFLAMQLVPGGTLGSRIADGGLTAGETVDLLGGVASALDAAHSVGLWHGAVHAGNVLMGVGGAYLSDLGTVDAPGTPGDDVRALAALAAECLTGRPAAESAALVPVAHGLTAGSAGAFVDDLAVVVDGLAPEVQGRRPAFPIA
ncbi:MAG: protein kinase [Patulibacter minatonensis]